MTRKRPASKTNLSVDNGGQVPDEGDGEIVDDAAKTCGEPIKEGVRDDCEEEDMNDIDKDDKEKVVKVVKKRPAAAESEGLDSIIPIHFMCPPPLLKQKSWALLDKIVQKSFCHLSLFVKLSHVSRDLCQGTNT